MTVLIVGRYEDPCCQLVDEALHERGSRVLFLPEDRVLPGLRFSWRPGTEHAARIGIDGAEVKVESLVGVLCRSYGVVNAEDYATRDGQYVSAEWHALLMAWLQALPCQTVVNRLKPTLWYRVRLDIPDLLALLPALAFDMPRSIVTTRADDARRFYQTLGGPARFSPLTQSARYRVASEDDWRRLELLVGTLPLNVSEWIDGSPFDAFVIGQRVLFVDGAGELSDIRDDHVLQRCLHTATALGLTFCRLSLMLRGDNWYCFGLDRLPRIDTTSVSAQKEIAGELAELLRGRARA